MGFGTVSAGVDADCTNSGECGTQPQVRLQDFARVMGNPRVEFLDTGVLGTLPTGFGIGNFTHKKGRYISQLVRDIYPHGTVEFTHLNCGKFTQSGGIVCTERGM